jgi:hypothetical protein
MKKIILEKNVPHFLSLKNKLSDLSWQIGLANFFLNDIPFSYTTSQAFAQYLGQFLNTYLQNHSQNKVNILELGGGTGILGLRLLSILSQQYPQTYQKIKLTLSDNAPSLIKQIQTSHKFKPYQKHVDTALINATCHIQIENQEIYEWRTTTFLENNALLVDTSSFPPKILKSPAIAHLLSTFPLAKIKLLAPKISPLLKTSYTRIPLRRIQDMSLEEKEHLIKFAHHIKTKKSILFNFNYSFYTMLKKITAQIKKELLIFSFDFGDPQKTYDLQPQDLQSNYGLVLASRMFFPYLKFVCTQLNLTYLAPRKRQAGSFPIIIYQGPAPAFLSKISTNLFSQFNPTKISQAIKSIAHLETHRQSKLNRILHTIPKLDQSNYLLLTQLSFYYFRHKMYSQALEYAQKSLPYYEEIGIPSYLLLAKAFHKQHNFKSAIQSLNKIFAIYPYFPSAHLELSFIQAKIDNWPEFEKAIKTYIKYCPEDIYWENLFLLLLVYQQTQQISKTKLLLAWFTSTIKNYPHLLPKQIIHKIKHHSL